MEEAKGLLKIIKCFLAEKDCILDSTMDENKLYQLAKVNSVSNFLQNWAQKSCQSQEIKDKIYRDYSTQIVKDTNQTIEMEAFLKEFEKNKIRTLLVKGAIIKDIYPQNYMREMCDIDLLVDEQDFKQAAKILKNMGFSKFRDEEKHLIFKKEPFITVEMHRELILKKDIGHTYFNDIWPLCIKYKDFDHIYQLNLESAYVFCILHLLIHFKFTGIKIKDILDVYLYHETYKNILDYAKLDAIFNHLDVKEFEQNIKNISYQWFGTNEINCFDDIAMFILKGSSLNNQVNYLLGKNNGKFGFMIKLLFPEMKIMKEKFPILEKFPLLLPAMWITRICKDVFSKGIPLKSRFKTIKLIKEADDQEVQKVKNIYKKLGVK